MLIVFEGVSSLEFTCLTCLLMMLSRGCGEPTEIHKNYHIFLGGGSLGIFKAILRQFLAQLSFLYY